MVGALAVAILAAIYVRSDISPGSHFGVASQEVLLDAPSSTLGDLSRNIEPLTARGGVFARVLTSQEAVAEIGRKSRIPADRISVQGPPLMVDGIPDHTTSQRSQAVVAGGYQVSVLRGDDLPLLTVSTQAPTPDEAARLANGTTAALATLVRQVQDQSSVPENRRLTIRVLGKATAHQAVTQPKTVMVMVGFLFVFGLGIVAILVVPGFVKALRELDLRELDLREPPTPPAATANGNGDLHSDGERTDDLDAMLEHAVRVTDDRDAEEGDLEPDGDDAPGKLKRRSSS